jgi:hypothetical protein
VKVLEFLLGGGTLRMKRVIVTLFRKLFISTSEQMLTTWWYLMICYFLLIQYAANQKFGLCEALLKVGDWNHARQLTKRLPEHCVFEQPPVARALCQLLNAVREPVYRK